MTAYLLIFIEEGVVRPLEHLELSTTLIIEILSWWAMDIRYTSFETQSVPLELAEENLHGQHRIRLWAGNRKGELTGRRSPLIFNLLRNELFI